MQGVRYAGFWCFVGWGDGTGEAVIDPQKIFTTLVRHPRFKFPSANQGEVLDKWFGLRQRSDNTIKMNTGSGKMLIGLLALQSSLNEQVGPALYVAPDNYLAGQVLQEAEDLGIKATDDINSAAYLSGDAILVVNVHKLFNGKSLFGVGETRITIGTVVIDDAHACLSVIADQFMMRLPTAHPAYHALFALFEEDLRLQSELGLIEVKGEDPNALILTPFWSWYDKREQVISILHKHRNTEALTFSWPLLKNVIPFCQCVFGGSGLEISPRCLPVDAIASFSNAKRRIYMTATLADDGVLVTQLQADVAAISDPIKPKGAGEIGDRMIIAPQEVNPDITDSDVKSIAVEVAKTRNVVVIVPSERRSHFWKDVASQVLMSSNISAGVDRLKSGEHVGITVLVNRYDGVDLPEEACRLLIIDGLPEVQGLTGRVEAGLLEGTQAHLLRQIQKLEQGMGRGVRSAEDRCAVLLLGPRLTQKINQSDARALFTPATLVQMDIGREVTRQIKGQPAEKLQPILDLCISGDRQWWQAGRARLAKAPDGGASRVEQSVVAQRQAFDFITMGQQASAAAALQAAINSQGDNKVRGYLKQQLAEVTHTANPARAQELLISAIADNRHVIKPLAGISHVKIKAPEIQAKAVASYISARFIDTNGLVLFTNALAGDLVWDEQRTDQFESAIRDLGAFLGFGSQRPDKEYRDGGPDNLWAIGDLTFLVIECKSGVKNDGRLISKDHCNQLLGARSWFARGYDQTCQSIPILVHPVNKFQSEASPSADMRIIDNEKLTELRTAVRRLGVALTTNGTFGDEATIASSLEHYGFTRAKFVHTHTKPFRG
ncbi:helicase C-terminal domain-containing protein [Agrobacterium sp.]|uniref:helicase C-terminal domain-containing protein n=1 Tax=Agrobacterium sp. TaxID=361 RepID=UPI0039195A23